MVTGGDVGRCGVGGRGCVMRLREKGERFETSRAGKDTAYQRVMPCNALLSRCPRAPSYNQPRQPEPAPQEHLSNRGVKPSDQSKKFRSLMSKPQATELRCLRPNSDQLRLQVSARPVSILRLLEHLALLSSIDFNIRNQLSHSAQQAWKQAGRMMPKPPLRVSIAFM